MPNKVLETKNLNAYYGDFQALFEVSIDLFEGEIIAIIGEWCRKINFYAICYWTDC